MASDVFRFTALSCALLSGHVGAIGFGDITMTSRLGEPLYAEVPILAEATDPIDTACFRLVPARDQDLPALTSARLQLHKQGREFRIIIKGREAVADPLFVIALRAGCGLELQRDYVLMPLPPTSLPELPRQAQTGEASKVLTTAKPRRGQASPAAPRPELPALRAGKSAEKRTTATPRPPRPPSVPTATEQKTASAAPPIQGTPKSRPPATGGGERLQLTAPPADFMPGKAAAPVATDLVAMEERMLRMEAMLKQLNDELARANQALALTTEALANQQKLQAIQTAITLKAKEESRAPSPVMSASATIPPSPAEIWPVLLLATAAGAIVTFLASRHITMHRRNPADQALSDPFSFQPDATSSDQAITGNQPRQPAGKQVTGDGFAPILPQKTGELPATDRDSDALMEIVEVMVSFGKIQDATETLAQHINEASPSRIEPWLMLLDLYRRGNMREQFEMLAIRILQKFNAHVSSWDESQTGIPS